MTDKNSFTHAERGTQVHTDIEAALADALITGTGIYVVRGEPVPSAKLREQLEGYGGRKIEWVVFDEAYDIPHEEPSPSTPKLIAKLAFRITLVIALAVGVLAVIS